MIIKKIWPLLCLIALLVSCKPAIPGNQASMPRPNAMAKPEAASSSSVMSDSVNYMHDRGVKYTLYDLSTSPPKAIGGAIVNMLGTGGEKGCCLSLPKTWRPGIKLRLVWGEADRQQTYPAEYTKELEVPRYDEPADLYVVFYPQHEVEIVVSKGEPGHPTWRGRLKQTPWENCLANNERKVCKRATARTFDTVTLQGYCPRAKKNGWENYETVCIFFMRQCMQDYEDESFCKSVLWGGR
jgi:hypothetical protein